MGKKITGPVQPNGSIPWIFTDHGKTWVGVDYMKPGNTGPWAITQMLVAKDGHGGTMITSGDGSQLFIPDSVIPFLIKALKKK
jgi:hypothetical protein